MSEPIWPIVMRYTHKYTIYAAHLTNEETHERLKRARLAKSTAQTIALYEQVLTDTHGHNFEVTVTGEFDTSQIMVHHNDEKLMVIDYEAIEEIIKQYHRVNLSVHRKFDGLKVTLDRLALMIWKDIKRLYPNQMIEVKVTGSPKQEAGVIG